MITLCFKNNSDGDQATAQIQKSATYHPMFMTMVPTYAFIDRATGRFNTAMGFKKDYAALISAAYDIDRCYDQFLNDADADSYEMLKSMGLHPEDKDVDAVRARNELIRDIVSGEIDGPFAKRFNSLQEFMR